MKHSNVAIFVPHNGCKNNCSFCNQKTITGCAYQPNEEDIKDAVKRAIKSGNISKENSEIAFFGGSFTAIEQNYMESLLACAANFVKEGLFFGIRISTRPDCINQQILNLLKKYKVTSIELGAQSMCDEVLLANERGHSALDVINASRLIKKNGFALGLQMMTGLYKSSSEIDIKTLEALITLKPDTLRIYPTVVLKGTKLEALYKEGKYNPPNVEESADLCAKLLNICINNKINVIKLGLHSSEDIKNNMVAGAYHPAFRELVESRLFYNKIMQVYKSGNLSKNFNLYVNSKSVSKVVGNNKENINKFKKLGLSVKIIKDEDLNKYEVKLKNSR